MMQGTRTGAPDPVTLEVIRHALIGCAAEMKLNLARTAYNPIIYEVLDFSCGVFDPQARLLAQADGLPIFLGNLGAAVSEVISDVGVDAMRDGDVYLFNDPYAQGNHVNDVTTVAPVFEAGRLVGFAVTRAHWLDIGGKDPGGSIDSTDITQEGLRLRSIRVVTAGRHDENILRMIGCNIRGAEAMLGDLRAQLSASAVGRERLLELFRRHGAGSVEAACAQMQAQGRARTRAFLRAIPDGTCEAESWIDDDGLGSGPLRVSVSVTIRGEEATFDVRESAPQARGPVNCGAAAALASCRVALKALGSPEVPACEGDFEPIRLIVDPAAPTIFNARHPAPTFLYGKQLTEVAIRALAGVVPDRAIAGNYDDLAGFMITGRSTAGRDWIHQEPEVGGWGAGADHDGEDALIFIGDGDARNIPVEILESRYPLRLLRHELRADSGGPGYRRGGLGIRRAYQILGEASRMLCIMDRTVSRPWGMFGGRAGQPSVVTVARADAPITEHTWSNGVPIQAGDVIEVLTGGGGGWGDALRRERERVRADLAAGYITADHAHAEYGLESGG